MQVNTQTVILFFTRGNGQVLQYFNYSCIIILYLELYNSYSYHFSYTHCTTDATIMITPAKFADVLETMSNLTEMNWNVATQAVSSCLECS